MAAPRSASASPTGANHDGGSRIKAVLGPTNTGKTHLAIERLCAHSSGAIGFPLRLLAREVYDRVCAIKGEGQVALITGEERIEPKGARWLLCTMEAMPAQADLAFVALDETQLCADRDRGHVFTQRLLQARGREETMILGSATMQPMVRALVPQAEIVSRPRFSTLSHNGMRKLSRIPPRSAIVGFSVEQVYALAEMLRRYRGGAAVVMGGLSPQTRNAQVALYQSGEVDYLVATDAIGMGLNLDIEHVAFASLAKFDGQRHRRLTTAEMAQIAGRAGRHQRDGTFGTLASKGGHDVMFNDEEVYAIEEHKFPPLTRLFWRNDELRFDSLATLMHDLEMLPDRPELMAAPEAIDLAVLRALAEDPAIAGDLRGAAMVERFWQVCRLPDFRQQGAETHARFVARLWQDLRRVYLGADFIAARIAELDNPSGDIDTLQHRIASIRSWSYIAQRPDWVLAREEMAARARAAEARLSDALHARLTERFVNRRTAVLMRKLTTDSALLPVRLEGDEVLVDGEVIGELRGLRFHVDADVRHADRKLLLAAAERHVPALLAARAQALTAVIADGSAELEWSSGQLVHNDTPLAQVEAGRMLLMPRIVATSALGGLPPSERERMLTALSAWVQTRLKPLAPLRRIHDASQSLKAGPALRALLLQIMAAGGVLARKGSGLDQLDKHQRYQLHRLGVSVGALDLFVPAMLRPAAQAAWRQLSGQKTAESQNLLSPVIMASQGLPPPGYRRAGKQAIRVDLAEKLLRAAYTARLAAGRKAFAIDPALAVSMGLGPAGLTQLLRQAGFRPITAPPLARGAFGPPRPALWKWQGVRQPAPPPVSGRPVPGNAFAKLAELVK